MVERVWSTVTQRLDSSVEKVVVWEVQSHNFWLCGKVKVLKREQSINKFVNFLLSYGCSAWIITQTITTVIKLSVEVLQSWKVKLCWVDFLNHYICYQSLSHQLQGHYAVVFPLKQCGGVDTECIHMIELIGLSSQFRSPTSSNKSWPDSN